MLNLMAEITAKEIHQATATDIARTANLPHIPFGTGFGCAFVLKHFDFFGKMSTKNNRPRPDVAHQIGSHITCQHRHSIASRNHWKKYIVLNDLAARF